MKRTDLRTRVRHHLAPVLAMCFVCVFLAKPSSGQDRSAADLLPQSVMAYAELSDLGAVIDLVMDHPLREQVESLPAFVAAEESGRLNPLMMGIAAFEGSMGKPWREALSVCSDGGIHLAFDPDTNGLALLIKSSDEDQLERLRGFALAAAQMGQGNVGPAKQGEYRGFKAFALRDEVKMALIDDWMLLTNQAELGKGVIDRYLDATGGALSENKRFREAQMGTPSGDSSLRLFIDVQKIRDSGLANRNFYSGKTDNIAAEVLLGGFASILKETPYVTAGLNLEDTGIQLTISSPHDRDWESGREYYFGDEKLASAPPLLATDDRLLALSTQRDLSQMWLRAGDLMTEKANEDLAKADTQLTTFFSGRDFGEDILGSLSRDVQLVVVRQSFENRLPAPAIKVPSFALIFEMRDPEETTPEFRRVFQSFIGFFNVVGAMKGQPQLDLSSIEMDQAKLYTATYLPEPELKESKLAPINFNFSPTIAFADTRMILSSTTALAKQLVTSPTVTRRDESPINTILQMDSAALQTILQDNRDQLIANNMLEKGSTPDEAAAQVDLLLRIVPFLHSASLLLEVTEERLDLTAEIQLSQIP